MIRVTTGSRLHFGLIGLGADAPRRFGGVGLMVDSPGLVLRAEPAAEWAASGPLAERALAFARRFAQGLGLDRPQRLAIERAPAEHVGLGTGTQLGLAVARALASAWDLSLTPVELAQHTGRGLRSALGIHGFAHGGFLIDGGKRDSEDVAPLLVRSEFPAEWRIILAVPLAAEGLHGPDEQRAFAELAVSAPRQAEVLCRLVLLGMLPALAERDCRTFGEALYDFNRRVGEVFAPLQGGIYAGPVATGVVDWFRRRGMSGVGQSSWGPTVFAVVPDEEVGSDLAVRLSEEMGADTVSVVLTQARNEGATVDC
jgi:beta-ribofuranosylaminobenzene 5'-phosphate synthase